MAQVNVISERKKSVVLLCCDYWVSGIKKCGIGFSLVTIWLPDFMKIQQRV